MKKVLFIGLGHMGYSLVKGVLKENKHIVYGYDVNKDLLNQRKETTNNLKIIENLKEIESEKIDVVVLGIRPIDVESVCSTLNSLNLDDKILVSMANAISLDFLKKNLPNQKQLDVFRIMPNMNASLQKSVTAIATESIKQEKIELTKSIFETCGIVEFLKEEQFGVLTAISGCLPSYVFSFMKGITDFAIKNGIDKDQTFRIVEQAIIGSVMNAAQSKDDLRTMVNQICVPNGSTIEGQNVLDRNDFEGIIEKCLDAAANKATKN